MIFYFSLRQKESSLIFNEFIHKSQFLSFQCCKDNTNYHSRGNSLCFFNIKQVKTPPGVFTYYRPKTNV